MIATKMLRMARTSRRNGTLARINAMTIHATPSSRVSSVAAAPGAALEMLGRNSTGVAIADTPPYSVANTSSAKRTLKKPRTAPILTSVGSASHSDQPSKTRKKQQAAPAPW